MTADTRKALRASGRLPAGDDSSKLEGLSYNGVPLAAETGGVRSGDENAISMGFNLLANYVSVWNLRKGTLTLLRRTPLGAPNTALQTDRPPADR